MKAFPLIGLVLILSACVSTESPYTEHANDVLKNPPRAESESAEQKAAREIQEKTLGVKITQLSKHDQLEPAALLKSVAPKYPSAALNRKIIGTVYVVATVSEDGRVTDTRIASSTDPIFDAPALDAVRQWRFKPAKKNGRPIVFAATIPIEFSPH